MSSAYSAPPFASAAARIMTSSITLCQVAQPDPAAPMRSAAATRTPSSSTRYWVSELIDICW